MVRYLIFVMFLFILIFNNHDFNIHKIQISEEISNNIEDGSLETLTKMVTSFSINYLKVLEFKNLYIFSYTTFKLDEKNTILSIGFLGNIFF